MDIIILGCALGIVLGILTFRLRDSISQTTSAVFPYTGLILLVLVVPFLGVMTFTPSEGAGRQSANQSVYDDVMMSINNFVPDSIALISFVAIIAFVLTRILIQINIKLSNRLSASESTMTKKARILKEYGFKDASRAAKRKAYDMRKSELKPLISPKVTHDNSDNISDITQDIHGHQSQSEETMSASRAQKIIQRAVGNRSN